MPAIRDHTTAYVFVPNRAAGTVSIIDTRTNRVLPPIPVGREPWGIAPSPDGSRLFVANGSSNSVTVLDVHARTVVATIPVDGGPHGVAVTPDGLDVYVTCPDADALIVIDAEALTIDGEPLWVGRTPWALAITPDGFKAYVTNASADTVTAVDLRRRTAMGAIRTGAGPLGLAIAPDGRTLYVANAHANTVTPIDITTDTARPSIAVRHPSGVAISPDGGCVYVASRAGRISTIDTQRQTVIDSVSVGKEPTGLVIVADRRLAYVTLADADLVARIDLTSLEVSSTATRVGARPAGPALGPRIIVPNDTPTEPLTIACDADLTALGFGLFLPFDGGVLRLRGRWRTLRDLSLLTRGAWIDTNGFDAVVEGDLCNTGSLTKVGAGMLTLFGSNRQGRDTIVLEGTLMVEDVHEPPIFVEGGTLGGGGRVGSVTVVRGEIRPGALGASILYATEVTMGAGASFVVDLAGPVAGTGHDALVVSATATLTEPRLVVRPHRIFEPGTAFTILTNVRGRFAHLAEGDIFEAAEQRFRITYTAGDGRDVVLTAVSHLP